MPDVHCGARAKVAAFASGIRDGSLPGSTGRAHHRCRQHRHRRLGPRAGHGGAGAGPLRHAEDQAATSCRTSTAPTSATQSPASIPATTLFIVSSKTFTTLETMTNANSARAWIVAGLGEASVAHHFAAVSTKLDLVAKFGIKADRDVRLLGLGRRALFDVVEHRPRAGHPHRPRAVRIVPARRATRVDNAFPRGAARAEHPHADGADRRLVPQRARLRDPGRHPLRPEARPLFGLPPATRHGEQRQVTCGSTAARRPATPDPVLWGEPGTNGQHAFFQLLHQGTEIVPIDFLAAAEPTHADLHHHEILLSNCFAQTQALMLGRTPRRGQGAARRRAAWRPAADRRARASQGVRRQPADLDLPLSQARPCYAGAPHRALRAPGLRDGGGVGHQSRSTSGASNSARNWPRSSARSSPTPRLRPTASTPRRRASSGIDGPSSPRRTDRHGRRLRHADPARQSRPRAVGHGAGAGAGA